MAYTAPVAIPPKMYLRRFGLCEKPISFNFNPEILSPKRVSPVIARVWIVILISNGAEPESISGGIRWRIGFSAKEHR